jgi:hypothetical protein
MPPRFSLRQRRKLLQLTIRRLVEMAFPFYSHHELREAVRAEQFDFSEGAGLNRASHAAALGVSRQGLLKMGDARRLPADTSTLNDIRALFAFLQAAEGAVSRSTLVEAYRREIRNDKDLLKPALRCLVAGGYVDEHDGSYVVAERAGALVQGAVAHLLRFLAARPDGCTLAELETAHDADATWRAVDFGLVREVLTPSVACDGDHYRLASGRPADVLAPRGDTALADRAVFDVLLTHREVQLAQQPGAFGLQRLTFNFAGAPGEARAVKERLYRALMAELKQIDAEADTARERSQMTLVLAYAGRSEA